LTDGTLRQGCAGSRKAQFRSSGAAGCITAIATRRRRIGAAFLQRFLSQRMTCATTCRPSDGRSEVDVPLTYADYYCVEALPGYKELKSKQSAPKIAKPPFVTGNIPSRMGALAASRNQIREITEIPLLMPVWL
jgi:hypothetical protein